jgi:hypothetical protein
MTARILPFPVQQPVAKKPLQNKSFELVHCWDTQFKNVERLNSISKLVVIDDDFREKLIRACDLDLELCKSLIEIEEYSMVAQHWISKIRKWRGKFHACRLVA